MRSAPKIKELTGLLALAKKLAFPKDENQETIKLSIRKILTELKKEGESWETCRVRIRQLLDDTFFQENQTSYDPKDFEKIFSNVSNEFEYFIKIENSEKTNKLKEKEEKEREDKIRLLIANLQNPEYTVKEKLQQIQSLSQFLKERLRDPETADRKGWLAKKAAELSTKLVAKDIESVLKYLIEIDAIDHYIAHLGIENAFFIFQKLEKKSDNIKIKLGRRIFATKAAELPIKEQAELLNFIEKSGIPSEEKELKLELGQTKLFLATKSFKEATGDAVGLLLIALIDELEKLPKDSLKDEKEKAYKLIIDRSTHLTDHLLDLAFYLILRTEKIGLIQQFLKINLTKINSLKAITEKKISTKMLFDIALTPLQPIDDQEYRKSLADIIISKRPGAIAELDQKGLIAFIGLVGKEKIGQFINFAKKTAIGSILNDPKTDAEIIIKILSSLKEKPDYSNLALNTALALKAPQEISRDLFKKSLEMGSFETIAIENQIKWLKHLDFSSDELAKLLENQAEEKAEEKGTKTESKPIQNIFTTLFSHKDGITLAKKLLDAKQPGNEKTKKFILSKLNDPEWVKNVLPNGKQLATLLSEEELLKVILSQTPPMPHLIREVLIEPSLLLNTENLQQKSLVDKATSQDIQYALGELWKKIKDPAEINKKTSYENKLHTVINAALKRNPSIKPGVLLEFNNDYAYKDFLMKNSPSPAKEKFDETEMSRLKRAVERAWNLEDSKQNKSKTTEENLDKLKKSISPRATSSKVQLQSSMLWDNETKTTDYDESKIESKGESKRESKAGPSRADIELEQKRALKAIRSILDEMISDEELESKLKTAYDVLPTTPDAWRITKKAIKTIKIQHKATLLASTLHSQLVELQTRDVKIEDKIELAAGLFELIDQASEFLKLNPTADNVVLDEKIIVSDSTKPIKNIKEEIKTALIALITVSKDILQNAKTESEKELAEQIASDSFKTFAKIGSLDKDFLKYISMLTNEIGKDRAFHICQNFMNSDEHQTTVLHHICVNDINDIDLCLKNATTSTEEKGSSPFKKNAYARMLLSKDGIEAVKKSLPGEKPDQALFDKLTPAIETLGFRSSKIEIQKANIEEKIKLSLIKNIDRLRAQEIQKKCDLYARKLDSFSNTLSKKMISSNIGELRDAASDLCDEIDSAKSEIKEGRDADVFFKKSTSSSKSFIEKNTSIIAKALQTTSNDISGKTPLVEEKVAEERKRTPTSTMALEPGGKARRIAQIEYKRGKIIEELRDRKDNLIKTLQFTIMTYIDIADQKEIDTNILDITKNAGIDNAYEIFDTYPEVKGVQSAKIAIANVFLQHKLAELKHDQINAAVDVSASENQESLYDYFANNKNPLEKEKLAHSILKNENMALFLLHVKDKEEKLNFLMSAITPDKAIDIFTHATSPEQLQICLLKSDTHRAALLNSNPEKASEALKKWDQNTFQREITNPNYGDWALWNMFTQKHIVNRLRIEDYLTQLDIKKLSVAQIKLLDKKVKIALLKQLSTNENSSDPGDKEKAKAFFEKLDHDKALALSDGLTLTDLTNTDNNPSSSALAIFLGREPNEVINYVKGNRKFRKSACVLLRELDSGLWANDHSVQEKIKKSRDILNHTALLDLIVFGVYHADSTYDLHDPDLKLSDNTIVRNHIVENWSGWGESTFNQYVTTDSSAEAFSFILSNPKILDALEKAEDKKEDDNSPQLKKAIEKAATGGNNLSGGAGESKSLTPKKYLSCIQSLESKDSKENAKKLSKLVLHFLNHYRSQRPDQTINHDDIPAIMDLIDKYKATLSKPESNDPQGRTPDAQLALSTFNEIEKNVLVPSALEGNIDLAYDNQYRILGPMCGRNPSLLGDLGVFTRARNHVPSTFLGGIIKYTAASGISAALGGVLLWFLGDKGIIPQYLAPASSGIFGTMLTGIGSYLGIGTLATVGVAFAGAGILLGGVGYFFRKEIKGFFKEILRKARTRLSGLNENEKDHLLIQNALNYLPPSEVRKAFLNPENEKNFVLTLIRLEDEDFNISINDKETRYLCDGIKQKYKFDHLYEQGGIFGKTIWGLTHLIGLPLFWPFLWGYKSTYNKQLQKRNAENKSEVSEEKRRLEHHPIIFGSVQSHLPPAPAPATPRASSAGDAKISAPPAKTGERKEEKAAARPANPFDDTPKRRSGPGNPFN